MNANAFLYQNDGYSNLIRRLVGVCLLLIAPFGASYCTKAVPYLVPAWRIGVHFLELPALPLALFLVLWLICFVCGVALALGLRAKIWLALPAVLIAFSGTCELTSIMCSYYVLLWLYLVAFLFYKPGHSYTRALMQLSVASCYLFSALEKLSPEWLSGNTMYHILHDGWQLRSQLTGITTFGWTQGSASFLALATVAVEFFLAFAFFFKQTRQAAFVVGTALHVVFAIFFWGIDLFAPVVFTGYLAFLDRLAPEAVLATPSIPRHLERACAWVVIAMIVWMPLRFYALPDIPHDQLTFKDRLPWSFAMFLFHEEAEAVAARYSDSSGRWHQVALQDRMKQTASNSECYALAQYLLRLHPQAQKVEIETQININNHPFQEKLCRADRLHIEPVLIKTPGQ